MSPDAVLGELEGLRALARSLVRGDSDADDLLQETAIAAITHPRDDERPMRPWLATVLRNRWRMDRRGRNRREAREHAQAISADDSQASAEEVLDRARALEKLAAALVALEEPVRTVVMRRYLDGQSAADIARALGIPGGTVRWRLKTGLERLRAALDESTPRWQRAFIPLAASTATGAVVVKAKTTASSLVLVLLLVASGIALWVTRGSDDNAKPAATSVAAKPGAVLAGSAVALAAPAMTRRCCRSRIHCPGRAIVVPVAAAGGRRGWRCERAAREYGNGDSR